MKQATRFGLMLSVATAAFAASPAVSQVENGDADEASTNAGMLEEIIITAVPISGTKMTTSVSTSSLSAEEIRNFAPRSTAEIFRNIPGIRSESSGGGGNANIAVRGLPISTGGAKFLSLQEDGLPVLQFGDIAFGNADNFLRADSTISQIQAVRGGSASTFAQNSPGGVINMISKTGAQEGGSIGITRGIGFDRTQLDFEYGGPLADDLSFHVGGFYRTGEGTRNTGFNGDDGGQIKANITKDFENGYVRLYFKHLNDRETTFLPMPLLATGTNENPKFRSVEGFDAKSDTPHSPFLLSGLGLDGENNRRRLDLDDGIRALSTAIGIEFEFDLADDWRISNRGRYSENSGGFVAPFPASVASASSLAEQIGGAGATLGYANGPSGGQAIANPAALNGNGLAMSVALFDVDVNDFDNFANDLKLAKSFEMGDMGDVDVTFGYYKASQNINMDWVWNSFLMEVKGKDAALLDVFDANGQKQTLNGLFQFGDPFGGCCTRNYNADYDTDAPYASVSWITGDLSLDASLRYTFGDVSGSFAGTIQAPFDVTGDGVIEGPEQNVNLVDLANPSPVDYTYDYASYTFGANYLLSDDLAVFARYSRGGSANADRLLFGPAIAADGSLVDEDAAVDIVKQTEAGVKLRTGGLNLFGTFFYAKTEEQNFEITSLTFIDRKYRAYGFELEGAYSYGPFDITAGLTWTDADIVEDNLSPDLVGNTPRRQADLIYQVTPSYTDYGFTIGANIIGTTSSFAQFNNELKLPGYTQVNLFANYEILSGLVLSADVNNLFDTLGVTEAEEGSILPNSDAVIRARAINGRTASVTLRYSF
ncbi:TonB-dependent receptor [Iodidimonas muriae]|uniref:TonB-dependent receptor n=1 Tax=Iodidimonas muriae TaxID=261467 RepID=A0ABQ2L8M7_9PROT|nr:TonB-dependent receptor [Iodidimonas muriae]GER05779.1 TonB-dependent receptor [Kordiimonadales bacterium JCM 17843]GGO06858.1 TonB-dependent receptor [Iodidimonas muriae]